MPSLEFGPLKVKAVDESSTGLITVTELVVTPSGTAIAKITPTDNSDSVAIAAFLRVAWLFDTFFIFLFSWISFFSLKRSKNVFCLFAINWPLHNKSE
ncbi:hypothetical protein MS53_0693 [Mycoplasmopsis synoviae 53]|uniref:Uncharacterized protein n=1 Tax=Mycoplasmopsis synoviae (strain 53) TaxID=262723 RepID=A4Q7Z7_MYCS5|nr:hypothetical protein MS53_0693 [Mycoplasmopsis synoviae 53]